MKYLINTFSFNRLILLAITTIVILGGCEEKFTKIDSKELKIKWDDSVNHTAVSWWYLGENENFHFIVEKWIMEKNAYKIDKQQLDVLLNHPHKFIYNESEWINLKIHHLFFRLKSGSESID